jgi:glucose/arabinose dehydrogenase
MRAIYVFALAAIASANAQDVCDGVAEVPTTDLSRVTVASGLTTGTSGPLFVTAPPGDAGRIFIVLQNGIIRQQTRGAAPTLSTVFLDIDARVNSTNFEQGLLGLAFDPAFATNGRFYVSYTRDPDGAVTVSRFTTLDGTGATKADPASEVVLFRIPHPEVNHNGGWMAFGLDGMLYIAVGDGGGGGDVHGTCGNGQNRGVLLGKVLRIDPRGGAGTPPDCGFNAGPYVIPPGNPLADGSGVGDCDEIWAYGLRNPWRNSFDALTGDLYVADVGEGCWEEINWAPGTSTGGENYGWRLFEGNHCFDFAQGCSAAFSPAGCTPACSDPAPTGDPAPNGTRLPILDYSSQSTACSAVGGYVYRGCRMPNFQGSYFYGDWCAGTVNSFTNSGGTAVNHRSWTAQLGAGLGFSMTSFGSDAQGELYITDGDGLVYAIVPPLPDFEVAGTGSGSPLKLEKSGDWSWENLQTASWHPISSYRVYRADLTDGTFNPGEVFNCVRIGASPVWPGGDPANPAPGDMFAYVVTALNAGGQQTSPGGAPTRILGAVACP